MLWYNRNPYKLVSEENLAQELFDLWLSSEGHRANILRPDYTRFAASVGANNNVNYEEVFGTYRPGWNSYFFENQIFGL